MKRIAAICAAGLLVAAVAAAQAPPKPPPEMEQIKSFEGTWTCSGNAPASPMGPAHKTQGVVQSKRDLGGFWIVGTVKETKTAENPNPVHGMFHMTYDAHAKNYVLHWLDNFGNWSTSTSPGWQGNTITFAGSQMVMGQKMEGRDIFIKKTERDWVHKAEMNAKGTWQTIVEENCTKK